MLTFNLKRFKSSSSFLFCFQDQFYDKQLYGLLDSYTLKINHGYMSTFLILLAILMTTHLLLVLSLNMVSFENIDFFFYNYHFSLRKLFRYSDKSIYINRILAIESINSRTNFTSMIIKHLSNLSLHYLRANSKQSM